MKSLGTKCVLAGLQNPAGIAISPVAGKMGRKFTGNGNSQGAHCSNAAQVFRQRYKTQAEYISLEIVFDLKLDGMGARDKARIDGYLSVPTSMTSHTHVLNISKKNAGFAVSDKFGLPRLAPAEAQLLRGASFHEQGHQTLVLVTAAALFGCTRPSHRHISSSS